jgi:hypothetical protein
MTKEVKILQLLECTNYLDTIKGVLPSDQLCIDIMHAIVPVYLEVLTEEEIDACLSFYSSEEGKRVLKKTPELIRKCEVVIGDLFSKTLHKQPQSTHLN